MANVLKMAIIESIRQCNRPPQPWGGGGADGLRVRGCPAVRMEQRVVRAADHPLARCHGTDE